MNVTMYFTSGLGQEGAALCVEDVYQSLEVGAAFDEVRCNNLGFAGATCLFIDESGIALEKTLQPGKGDIVGGADGFSVGTIVWTPVE